MDNCVFVTIWIVSNGSNAPNKSPTSQDELFEAITLPATYPYITLPTKRVQEHFQAGTRSYDREVRQNANLI